MQKSQRLIQWLENNRQWTRLQNIGFARLLLNKAHFAKNEEDAVFFASVLAAYNYSPEEKRIERARRTAEHSGV